MSDESYLSRKVSEIDKRIEFLNIKKKEYQERIKKLREWRNQYKKKREENLTKRTRKNKTRLENFKIIRIFLKDNPGCTRRELCMGTGYSYYSLCKAGSLYQQMVRDGQIVEKLTGGRLSLFLASKEVGE
jgi:hypothetical protein